MGETRSTLQRIRTLLDQEPAQSREALRLAKDLFLHGICVQEQDSLRQAAILLLERLVVPALAGVQDKQARVGRLLRQLQTTSHFQYENIAPAVQEIAVWLESLSKMAPLPETDPPFPLTLAQEALIVLGGRTIQELFSVEHPGTWSEMGRQLGVLIQREHKLRAQWQREQDALRLLLRQTMVKLNEGVQLIAGEDEELAAILQATEKSDEELDWPRIQEQLVVAVRRFRERTVDVRYRLREAEDVVERSRLLVRQADWALMETRDERLLDSVSGLPNRFGLLARLEQVKQEEAPEGFALVALVVDDYAGIVQDLGRERVHRLLAAVAGRLVSLMKPGEYLARYNEETFVLIALALNESKAVELAGYWRSILDRTRFELPDARLVVRSGYGVAGYENGDNTETLLGLATLAAKEALRAGGTRIHTVPSRKHSSPTPHLRK
ncbi:GGDEF domain-containing protein [Candidatus Magnetaquicoccus inordinatus]|uniref:GGDEF domain-containing protein n=1 Tax=Candidatus Magnetaquicoccus inordinatus TaxID=2496818 RepID=UPI00187D2BCD|nr:diguanylate cyclase [Candidatus Magnetaquicoccus inordinatus]